MSAEAFRDQLLKGEKIIWTGRPAQGLILTGQDAFLIPFSLIWTAVTSFIAVKALTQPGTPAFSSFMTVLFALVGVYLLIGRFLVDAWVRSRIDYAITSSRILISRAGPFPAFTALRLDRLPDVSLSERGGGRGTVRFGPQVPVWGRGNGFSMWTPSLDPTPQFIRIEDARSVFNQIQQRAVSPQA